MIMRTVRNADTPTQLPGVWVEPTLSVGGGFGNGGWDSLARISRLGFPSFCSAT